MVFEGDRIYRINLVKFNSSDSAVLFFLYTHMVRIETNQWQYFVGYELCLTGKVKSVKFCKIK